MKGNEQTRLKALSTGTLQVLSAIFIFALVSVVVRENEPTHFRAAAIVAACTVTGSCSFMGPYEDLTTGAKTWALVVFVLLNPAWVIGVWIAKKGNRLLASLAHALLIVTGGIIGAYFLINGVFSILGQYGFSSPPYPQLHDAVFDSWILFSVSALPLACVSVLIGIQQRPWKRTTI